MTNSLIPYSFIPGTKAMASEVNANFIALAGAVEEGKTFTTEAIENLEANVETQLEETFATKLEVDLSNSKHISNCILEMPENIKYEINATAGTFKLLAGSKVYVSTSGTFEAVTLSSDTVYGATELWTSDESRSCFIVYDPSTNMVLAHALDYTFSQTTAPTSFLANYALWYNPDTNIMKCTINGGSTWTICSLPLLVGRPSTINSSSKGWNGTIDTVFNGMGFFGQYTFMLPGVKYLIPNGRNADGSLKNTTITSSTVNLANKDNQNSILALLTSEVSLSAYGVEQYYEQDTAPTTFWNANAIWYDTARNRVYRTIDSGATWSAENWIVIGRLIKTGLTANITSLSFNPTFRAITANDVLTILNNGLYRAQNGYFKLNNGLLIQWGRFTGTDGTVTLLQPYLSSGSYITFLTHHDIAGGGNAVNFNWIKSMFSYNQTSTSFEYRSANGTGYERFWFSIGY